MAQLGTTLLKPYITAGLYRVTAKQHSQLPAHLIQGPAEHCDRAFKDSSKGKDSAVQW